MRRIIEILIFYVIKFLNIGKDSWKAEKVSAFIWAVFYIPYRKLRYKKRMKEEVENQYNQIAGLYIRDNYTDGKYRYCVADGRVEYLSTVSNMKKIREEINDILKIERFDNVLEVGVGELTSLAAVCAEFGPNIEYFGVDLSLNRLQKGVKEFEKRCDVHPVVSKSDAVALPFSDNSFDLVYTRHTLEQIPDLFEKVIDEIIRVSRKRIILFEPAYELGGITQKLRMMHKDYVRGIPRMMQKKQDKVRVRKDFFLMRNSANPLNHTGCYDFLIKQQIEKFDLTSSVPFVCPVSKGKLAKKNEYLFCSDSNLAYPVIEDIPILEAEHAVYLTE